MLAWEETDHEDFFPVLVDDSTRSNDRLRRLGYSSDDDDDDRQENQSTIKSIPAFANYDYLTVDSDLTEDQLLLCSYYVFGYLMMNRKWGLFPLIPSRLQC